MNGIIDNVKNGDIGCQKKYYKSIHLFWGIAIMWDKWLVGRTEWGSMSARGEQVCRNERSFAFDKNCMNHLPLKKESSIFGWQFLSHVSFLNCGFTDFYDIHDDLYFHLFFQKHLLCVKTMLPLLVTLLLWWTHCLTSVMKDHGRTLKGSTVWLYHFWPVGTYLLMTLTWPIHYR